MFCHPNQVHACGNIDRDIVVTTSSEPPPPLTQAFPLLFLCNLSRVDGQRAAHERCSATQRATTALVVATRAAVDRHGPRRSPPPQRWTVEEESGGEARETFYAPRGPETLPLWMRPAPPSEVAGPQVVAATSRHVAARAPLLTMSSLRGADGVDDTAVERRKRRRTMRTKKKRRKKKLPCSGCTRRRRRQWHDRCAGFAGCDAPRDVYLLVDDWPEVLGIVASMDL